jgi:hypothetical protein
MTTRVRNQIVSRENRGLQAKSNAVKTNPTRRAALGEIGNKQAVGVSGQEKDLLKKITGVDKRTGEVTLPQIQVNDAHDDIEMEEDHEEVQNVRIFPEGVIDIDALEDQNNPQLCVEYAPAIYAYLRDVEDGLSIRKDFLTGCFVNGKMRGVLIDWLIEVHSQFKLLQETLYMTIYIIDKFLQVEGFTVRRNKLQLVGVSAMFIASKVEEMYAPEINDFVYITDNAYTAAEIRQMELRMLNTLGFNFSRPLPLHFLRRNSKAGDVDVLQHTVAKYLIEMSLLEYDLAHLPPSLMAAASLFLSEAAGAQCQSGQHVDPDPPALLHLHRQGDHSRRLQARPRSHQARREQAAGCPQQVHEQEVHEGRGARRLAGGGGHEAVEEAAQQSVIYL